MEALWAKMQVILFEQPSKASSYVYMCLVMVLFDSRPPTWLLNQLNYGMFLLDPACIAWNHATKEKNLHFIDLQDSVWYVADYFILSEKRVYINNTHHDTQ